jgi:hypothetical protein
MDGGGSPGDVMMSKVSREFAAEGVSMAVKQEDKLKILLSKMGQTRDISVFNTLRKKALEVRQHIITQRESAGLAKDSNLSRSVVEELFPIPSSR